MSTECVVENLVRLGYRYPRHKNCFSTRAARVRHSANASLRRVRQQRRKWPAASHREQMVICHAMRTLHTCANGARAVANLRNRRDRGSTLRRADLKRWVHAQYTVARSEALAVRKRAPGRQKKPLGVIRIILKYSNEKQHPMCFQ